MHTMNLMKDLEKLLNFFRKLLDSRSSKKRKTSGAFSHPTVPSCHPCILLNYQGKIRDVMTLAHELGHGIHQYLANKNGVLLADTPANISRNCKRFWRNVDF